MPLIDATQLLESLVLPAVDVRDILNYEALPNVVVWVLEEVGSKEEASEIIRSGIEVVILAFGMKFIGLRRHPNGRNNRTTQNLSDYVAPA